jgi:cohesin loading factor subunit SCC2
MTHPIIKKTVIGRFSDEAISVREAAVSLVGSYVMHLPAVANDFHPAFMVGLNDSGVSVRKRTIKILQDILCSNPAYKSRAAACSEMLRLAADPKEDDGVRDLIYDLFLALWLENGDVAVVQTTPRSPVVSPSVDEELMSPGAYVEGLEEATIAGVVTPAPKHENASTSSPTAKSTRSTARRINNRRAQIRSEIAAEQMVEVVKSAGSGEGLTSLFRELLKGVADSDKDRKASDRKKRQVLAQGHCSMLVDALVEILLTTEENRAKFQYIGVEVVAIVRTISVFADVSPLNVIKHLDTLLPYLKADNGLRMKEESIVVSSLCNALSQVSTVLERGDIDKLDGNSLANDLAAITYKFGPKPCSAAVHALSSLSHRHHVHGESPFPSQILKLAKTFYNYMMKHRDEAGIVNKVCVMFWKARRDLSTIVAQIAFSI